MLDKHFEKHGWRPIGLFQYAVHDAEMGCMVTYWENKYSNEVRMFIIDSFANEYMCGEV